MTSPSIFDDLLKLNSHIGQAQAITAQASAFGSHHQQQMASMAYLSQRAGLGLGGGWEPPDVPKDQTIREELQEEVDGWIK